MSAIGGWGSWRVPRFSQAFFSGCGGGGEVPCKFYDCRVKSLLSKSAVNILMKSGKKAICNGSGQSIKIACF